MLRHGLLLAFLAAAFCQAAWDRPATADETQQFDRFLANMGLQAAESPTTPSAVFESARQDFGLLTVNTSCHTHTPLQIGDQRYAEGLGTHANSRIVFLLKSPQKTLTADVGVDKNYDTLQSHAVASVAFVVKGDGRELARTPICRVGDAPRRLRVSVENVNRLELLVTDAGDGILFDQADWGSPRLTAADGKSVDLVDVVKSSRSLPFLSQATLPASFVYGGQPSGVLLARWPRVDKPGVTTAASKVYEMTWSEPGTGFTATWRADVFRDQRALEFRWIFANRGVQPSKPLSDVWALDLRADGVNQARLVHSNGGLTGPFTGEPAALLVSSSDLKAPTMLSAAGGRSSNKDLPFFVLHDDAAQGGIFVGIGWTGQWQADFHPDGVAHTLRATAGMPGIHLALPPGQRIRSPGILLGSYQGDDLAGSNALRRCLYDRYVALLGDQRPLPPVSWNHWFTFENRIDEEMLKKQIDAAAGLGLEYFCIDSGWFDGGFPSGVGNWTIDRKKFPHGLAPLGKHANEKGMKLGLWFEIGRADQGTRLQKEHPEWMAGNQVRLEIPEAREWLLQMMCRFIDEGRIRWIRYDYNFDPLAQWNQCDSPETQGLTQIRYLEGENELLDRLRAKYPDLLIESCSGGGRRIGMESIRRAHTFWKSDETSSLLAARFQASGGNRFLPGGLLNTNLPAGSSLARFDLHSLFAGPLGFAVDWTTLDASARTRVREEIAAYKKVRYLLNKDYYPLFPQTLDLSQWVGWEFYDPANGEGFVVVLRPAESIYSSAQVRLRGVDKSGTYRIGAIEENSYRDHSGQELLSGLSVPLGPGESRVLHFQRR
jgi:alpha-galactosidase